MKRCAGGPSWPRDRRRSGLARPPVHTVQTKLRIVLGVLRGELSAAQASRRHGVSETSIGKWKEQFLEGGKAGLQAAGQRRGPTGREAQLAAQVDELTRALGEAHVELRLARRDTTGLPPMPSWR
jgi:transposase